MCTYTDKMLNFKYLLQIHKALLKDSGTLFECEGNGTDKETFGLKHLITEIKPNYEAMIKSGALKVTDVGVQQGNVSGH